MRRPRGLGSGIEGRWSGLRSEAGAGAKRGASEGQLKNSIEEAALAAQCSHLGEMKFTTTKTHVCEQCVKMGDRWVHLRLCMECGNVGCCDSSKNKHATKHFHASKHPLMRSIEPGESWVWCYVDDLSPGEILRGEFVAG